MNLSEYNLTSDQVLEKDADLHQAILDLQSLEDRQSSLPDEEKKMITQTEAEIIRQLKNYFPDNFQGEVEMGYEELVNSLDNQLDGYDIYNVIDKEAISGIEAALSESVDEEMVKVKEGLITKRCLIDRLNLKYEVFINNYMNDFIVRREYFTKLGSVYKIQLKKNLIIYLCNTEKDINEASTYSDLFQLLNKQVYMFVKTTSEYEYENLKILIDKSQIGKVVSETSIDYDNDIFNDDLYEGIIEPDAYKAAVRINEKNIRFSDIRRYISSLDQTSYILDPNEGMFANTPYRILNERQIKEVILGLNDNVYGLDIKMDSQAYNDNLEVINNFIRNTIVEKGDTLKAFERERLSSTWVETPLRSVFLNPKMTEKAKYFYIGKTLLYQFDDLSAEVGGEHLQNIGLDTKAISEKDDTLTSLFSSVLNEDRATVVYVAGNFGNSTILQKDMQSTDNKFVCVSKAKWYESRTYGTITGLTQEDTKMIAQTPQPLHVILFTDGRNRSSATVVESSGSKFNSRDYVQVTYMADFFRFNYFVKNYGKPTHYRLVRDQANTRYIVLFINDNIIGALPVLPSSYGSDTALYRKYQYIAGVTLSDSYNKNPDWINFFDWAAGKADFGKMSDITPVSEKFEEPVFESISASATEEMKPENETTFGQIQVTEDTLQESIEEGISEAADEAEPEQANYTIEEAAEDITDEPQTQPATQATSSPSERELIQVNIDSTKMLMDMADTDEERDMLKVNLESLQLLYDLAEA